MIQNKPLSVVFFSHDAGYSGACRSLMDLLVGLRSRGVRCSVVVPYQHIFSTELSKAGFDVFSLDIPNDGSFMWRWTDPYQSHNLSLINFKLLNKILKKIVPKIKSWRTDIVFSQTIVSPWGCITAWLLGKPHILSVREYGTLDHGLVFKYGFKDCVNALYQDSAVVFAITKDVANFVFKNTDRLKIIVHYNNIHLEEDEQLQISPSGNRRPQIGILGLIAPSKGQLDLVNACIQLREAGRDIDCHIIGQVADNAYNNLLIKRIRENKMDHFFHLTDHVKNPHTWIRQMDVIVCCSRVEALGRTLFEAILLNKPIVFTESGGPKEVFGNKMYGLSYIPGDASGLAERIAKTIDDPAETSRRVEIAKEYVLENFNEKNYTEPVYNTLLDISKNSSEYICKGHTLRLIFTWKEIFLIKIFLKYAHFFKK